MQQKQTKPDPGSYFPGQYKGDCIQPRFGETAILYRSNAGVSSNISKKTPPPYPYITANDNIFGYGRALSSGETNGFMKPSPDQETPVKNPAIQHIRQRSDPKIRSANSTPVKEKSKPTVSLSHRSNSTGASDRHPNYISSQKNAEKSLRGQPLQPNGNDPRFSPMAFHQSRDTLPEQSSAKKPAYSYDNMNNVAGHEVAIMSSDKQQRSPHKSRKSRRDLSDSAGKSYSGSKQSVPSLAGVDCNQVNHSWVEPTNPHFSRYPMDNEGSSVCMKKHTFNNCGPTVHSTPRKHQVSGRGHDLNDGTGEESVV